jgi:hypothetical protein
MSGSPKMTNRLASVLHHLQHTRNKIIPLKIRQASQIGRPQVAVFVGIAARAAQRALARYFQGK